MEVSPHLLTEWIVHEILSTNCETEVNSLHSRLLKALKWMPKTCPKMSTNSWQALSPPGQIKIFDEDSLLQVREGGQGVVRLKIIQSH